MLHFGVEGCAAHYELAHLASECGMKFFSYFIIYDAVDSGYGGKDLHVPFAQDWLDGRLVYLLHYEGDRYHDVRLNLLHCLEKQRRGRSLAEIVYGDAAYERIEELVCQSVDMSHGKHGDDVVVVVAGNVALAEVDGCAEAFVT